MIGVLTCFLDFQIKQSERGISINKERYVKDLLRKYDKISSSMKTPVVPPNMLGPDLNGKAINESQYRVTQAEVVQFEMLKFLQHQLFRSLEDWEVSSLQCMQRSKDSPDDEEDTRSSYEYLDDLEEEYQARALLAKSKRFFKKAKYNKVKDKLALLSSSSSASNASMVKKKAKKVPEMVNRSNLLSKHRNFVLELNACKEQLLVLKQVKLDFLTMQQVNTEILKENKNLRTELKELKPIIETWLNSSNKVNQCISEQIPSQKKRILGVDQLTEDSSSSELKDLVFVKSSADDTKVTIPGVERPWLSEAEGFILANHDTSRILTSESQRNTTDHLVVVTDSSATDYDSTDESSVCSTPLPPLKKLDGAEPISGPKTIKSILRSKSTFKDEALKSVIINEPSLAPAKGNKSFSALKVHSAPAGKLKSLKIEDDPPLAIHLKSLGRMSSRPDIPRPSKCFFPSCIQCGGISHLSNECLYYPICKLCGSYDHDTNGHNRIISLEREINPRNPQHTFKKCEAFGSPNHTTTDHYDIEWFKRGEALQAKKVYIHNHKDHLGKFNEKADDGYLLRYSLVSKAFRVFNTRIQQTEETYHITFDESHKAIKFSKTLVDNINIVESKRYPPDEYLHPYEPSQRYRTNSNDVSFIEPYEYPEPVVLETEVSSDQNDQIDQYDQPIFEHLSSPNTEDTSAQNTTIPSLPVPSMVTPAPQDRWSQDKHIELVNIIYFLSEEEPKKVFEALKHPGWVDAMQYELNQFARNKVWR
ncbi:retrovirus-related pol polyprotein from transposon TNT 1-94 [Tanacetum coccineum]